jgi:hypothetical protein
MCVPRDSESDLKQAPFVCAEITGKHVDFLIWLEPSLPHRHAASRAAPIGLSGFVSTKLVLFMTTSPCTLRSALNEAYCHDLPDRSDWSGSGQLHIPVSGERADLRDTAFSLPVLTERPHPTRLFLKKNRTSLPCPVQSRSENALAALCTGGCR